MSTEKQEKSDQVADQAGSAANKPDQASSKTKESKGTKQEQAEGKGTKQEQAEGKGTKQSQQAEGKAAQGTSAEGKDQQPEVQRPKKVKVQLYSVKGDIAENQKCPPQARVVVQAVKEIAAKHGGKATREQVIELLQDPERLKTTQDPTRIFSFYRPKLIEMGVLEQSTEERIIEPEPAPKGNKTAA